MENRKFYIKKLGHQEMGSPGEDGIPKRGRYLYLSKDSADFFPLLSQTLLNDTIMLPIVMPFAFVKIYAKFVYHNSKYASLEKIERPRNEFRLYLTKDLDQNRKYFHVDDIVVIERNELTTDEGTELIYSINLFNSERREYEILEQIIEKYNIGGHNALMEGDLSFIPRIDFSQAPLGVQIPQEVQKEVVKQQEEILSEEEPYTDEIPSRDEIKAKEKEVDLKSGAHLFNSVSFRDFIIFGYENKCAITGKSIVWQTLSNIEAAHIKPKAHGGPFLPSNGIALCRDMHWAFDKGFITISNDYKVVVHDEIPKSLLSDYNNQSIALPDNPFFKPEIRYLEHHQKHIFGLFKLRGGIRADY